MHPLCEYKDLIFCNGNRFFVCHCNKIFFIQNNFNLLVRLQIMLFFPVLSNHKIHGRLVIMNFSICSHSQHNSVGISTFCLFACFCNTIETKSVRPEVITVIFSRQPYSSCHQMKSQLKDQIISVYYFLSFQDSFVQ